MLNGREKFRFFGFSFVALMGMIFLFNLIIQFPVSSEMSEEERQKLVKQFGEEAVHIDDLVKNAEQVYEELQKQLAQLPKFKPPKDNRLTEEQIHKHYQVVKHCWDKMRNYRMKYIKQLPDKGLGRGIAIMAQGSILLTLYQTEGLVKVGMTEAEFNWVGQRLWESALFAVNQKLKSGKLTSEEKELLMIMQEQLCRLLGLFKEDKTIEIYPEKLDTSKIPRSNIELFLRFKNEVRWRKINFESIEFNEQEIMNAAQALPG